MEEIVDNVGETNILLSINSFNTPLITLITRLKFFNIIYITSDLTTGVPQNTGPDFQGARSLGRKILL